MVVVGFRVCVAHLSVRHASALKPAVKHVVDAPQHALAAAAGDGDVVYEVTVQVSHLERQASSSSSSSMV